jgi:hypothetical protein
LFVGSGLGWRVIVIAFVGIISRQVIVSGVLGLGRDNLDG